MLYQVNNLGDQRLHYNIKFLKKGHFDILHEISENITLIQLIRSVGNVYHAVSIVVYLIFDSNYKKALLLKTDSLNII